MMDSQSDDDVLEGKHKKANKDEPESPAIVALDKLATYGEQFGILMSVMDAEYEGGDFCKGLTATFEAKNVVMQVIQKLFSRKSDEDSADFLQ